MPSPAKLGPSFCQFLTSRYRTLFATHDHEPCDSADRMAHAVCMPLDAPVGRHDDMFGYRVKAGRAEALIGAG